MHTFILAQIAHSIGLVQQLKIYIQNDSINFSTTFI